MKPAWPRLIALAEAFVAAEEMVRQIDSAGGPRTQAERRLSETVGAVWRQGGGSAPASREERVAH